MTENKVIKYLIYAMIILSVTFHYGAYAAGVIAFLIMLRDDAKVMARAMAKQKVLVFIAVAFVFSTLFSKVMGYSLLIDGVVLLHLIIYIVIVKYVSKENIEEIFRLMNIMGIFICMYGIYQYFTGHLNIDKSWTDENAYGNLLRIYSTLRNPNIFAAYLTFNICFAMAYALKKKRNILITANIILASICLILTFSRGGFYSLIGALLLIGLLFKEKKALYYIMLMVIANYGWNFMQGSYRGDLSKLIVDSSSMYRLEIWKAAWELFKENIVFGVGPGSITRLLSYSTDKLSGNIMHAHNIPLHVMAEIGLFGLTAFAALFLSELKRLTLFWRKHRDAEYSFIAIGFVAVCAAMLIHGMVDCAVLIPSRSLIFLVYLGLFPALCLKALNQPEDQII